MLKSWDFIDPKLAQQLSSLNREMKDLKQQKTKILNNSNLSKNTKNKLLSYNQQCMDNVNRMLQKQKSRMVDYMDEQINVVTKKQIKYEKQDQLSTLVFHHRKTNSFNSGQNKTKNLDETTVEQNKILGNLSTNGGLSVKVQSFELHDKNIQNLQGTIVIKKEKKLAFKDKSKIKRLMKRSQKLRQQLCVYKCGFKELQTLYEEEKHKNQENQQIIKLLYKKINILENKQQEKINKIKQQYEQRHRTILKEQRQLDQIRKQNKQLQLERNQLLKLMKKIK